LLRNWAVMGQPTLSSHFAGQYFYTSNGPGIEMEQDGYYSPQGIDRELLGKPAKPSRRHLRRSMHGCPAQLLDSLLLYRRKRAGSAGRRACGGCGRDQASDAHREERGARPVPRSVRRRPIRASLPAVARNIGSAGRSCDRHRALLRNRRRRERSMHSDRAARIARRAARSAPSCREAMAVARLPRAAARGPPRRDGRQTSAALATRRSRRQGRPRRNLDLPPSADGPSWQASAHSWPVDRSRGPRPIPRSTRPGVNASRTRNCSATFNGA